MEIWYYIITSKNVKICRLQLSELFLGVQLLGWGSPHSLAFAAILLSPTMLSNVPASVVPSCILCWTFEIVITIIWMIIYMQKQNNNVCLHGGAMILSTEMMIPYIFINYYFGWQQLNFSPFGSSGEKIPIFKKGTFCNITASSIPLKKKNRDGHHFEIWQTSFFSLDLSGKSISYQTLMKKKQQSRTTYPEHIASSIICTQNFSNC